MNKELQTKIDLLLNFLNSKLEDRPLSGEVSWMVAVKRSDLTTMKEVLEEVAKKLEKERTLEYVVEKAIDHTIKEVSKELFDGKSKQKVKWDKSKKKSKNRR